MLKFIGREPSHVISAQKLIELLQSLPEGCYVAPNRVENLSILRLSAEQVAQERIQDIDQLGFIDLGYDEKVVLDDDEDDEDDDNC